MNQHDTVAVRFDRVAKMIGPERILEDVSFAIPRGTAFSILGRRGAGKTTVLKLAIGLAKPDQGKISIHGEDVNELNAADLLRVRRSTGFVFQNCCFRFRHCV